MPDIEEKGDNRIVGRTDSPSLEPADVSAARIADSSSVKAAHRLNRNTHNGSAGGSDQQESIQIVTSDCNGKHEVIAARQSERLESVSMEELILNGRQGDKFAVEMVQQMRVAKELPASQCDKTLAKLQATVDKLYGRGVDSDSLGKLSKQEGDLDTQAMKALAPSHVVA